MSPGIWHQGCCCGGYGNCVNIDVWREAGALRYAPPFVLGDEFAETVTRCRAPVVMPPALCAGFTTDPAAQVYTLDLWYRRTSNEYPALQPDTLTYDLSLAMSLACHVGFVWPRYGGGSPGEYGVDDANSIALEAVERFRRHLGSAPTIEDYDCDDSGWPLKIFTVTAGQALRIQNTIADETAQFAAGGPVVFFWPSSNPAPANWASLAFRAVNNI